MSWRKSSWTMALPKSWKYLKYHKISKWTQTEMFSYHFCISIFVEKKNQGWFGQRAENQRPTFAHPKFQWSINLPYKIYIAKCF